MLRALSLCLMQSTRDAERIVALGAEPSGVHITGNIKFDQPLPAQSPDAAFRKSLSVGEREHLLLAGSTHPVEEEQLVAAYQTLSRTHPSLVLMLVPRHIERVDRVEAMVWEAGLACHRRSRSTDVGYGPRVIILDTRGELARAYHEATVAFVGGTLVPVGGHNLLEPAVWGKPVLFGPYTDHCAETATWLLEAGGGFQVHGPEDIVRYVDEWLVHQGRRESVGGAARQVVMDNQGALQRSLHFIEAQLASSLLASQSTPSGGRAADPAMARP